MKAIGCCTTAERLQRGRELIRAAKVEIGILEDVRAELQDDLKRIEARIEAHRKGLAQLEGAAGLLAANIQREEA